MVSGCLCTNTGMAGLINMTKKNIGLIVLVAVILVKLNFFPDTKPLPYGADPDRAMWNVNSDTYEFSRWSLNILLGGGLIWYLWKKRKD